ncbi:protein POLAR LOCALIZATION DURING ASYMMETRIC DIVISION AND REDISTRIBUTION [Citrus sinensis]|uniref:Protein POLAR LOCALIZATION DURING ASYMMETRIC DIVISION AND REDISTRIBUTION n=1 Tax=Citrus sinensis TaxID=2711 RepID=A0ACB8NM54_CITSI|nr:protein POLAR LOCALIZATION DURING ASYMMETRIC DIVISION AND REDISTRIBUTION [Citrus sinensis]KAH9798778.1 protein POLAR LOCALIZATION DURING ASYMMETRIC DIVISION AND REDISTRIBUTION [Citrus sinensis]
MSNNNSSLLKSSSSTAPPLRIADVLLLHLDDDQEEQVDGAVLPFSLVMDGCRRRRREAGGVVSRWLTCFRRPEDQHDDDRDDVTNGRDLTSVVAHNDHSGPSGGCRWCQRESSFDVGVGCSLLYLIAASKAELDKMMDLRTQMQVLLQNFKEELQVRNASEEGTGSNCHRSSQNLAISHVQPESSTTAIMTFDQSLKCDTPKDVECLEGIDQLQAELEAELERLQLHLEKEKLLQHPEQRSVEAVMQMLVFCATALVRKSCSFSHLVTLKDTASSRSCSMSAGEVSDTVVEAQEAFSEVDCGVPPYELEKRLHAVLEARQQEHIRELEAALECAKHKLSEKEMEISWWRDTARLIAQHVPGPSRCTSDRG